MIKTRVARLRKQMGRPVDENGWLVDEELGGQKTNTSSGTATRNNAMQTERTRTKTIFHFDSGQHPGCTVLINNAVIPGVTVTVVQDYATIYDGTHVTPHEVKGMVRVFGQVCCWPDATDAKYLGPDRPVDVRVYALDPMTSKNYVMEITGAYITNLVTHAFLAAAWKPWRELDQPHVQVDVPVDQTPGTPNKNGDQFCTDAQDLLGKFQDYQAKDQPVDKSVPKKTDAPASRQAKVLPPDAFRSPLHVLCPNCKEENFNVKTHKCDGCGFILQAKDPYRYVGEVPQQHTTYKEAGAPPIQYARTPPPQPCLCGHVPVVRHSVAHPNMPSYVHVICACGRVGPEVPYDLSVPDAAVRAHCEEALAIHAWNKKVWKERRMSQDKTTNTMTIQNNIATIVQLANKLQDAWCDCTYCTTMKAALDSIRTAAANSVAGDLCALLDGPIDQKQKDVPPTDTAHLGPWTTVRACLDCGVLVTGGPTRCRYCADKITQIKNGGTWNAAQEKRIDAATKLCCSPEIQAYIAYLEHLDRKEKP